MSMARFSPPRSAALILLCWASLARADAPARDTPADYAHAIPVTVSGRNAVVQLRLPLAVYLNARSADLRDLRVFDAGGKALPFALTEPAARAQASRRQSPVTVFPVTNAPSQAPVQKNEIEIRTSADGAVTAITTRHGTQARGGADDARLRPVALVLDMGTAGAAKTDGVERPAFDALVFTLPDGMRNYHAQVELEVSDDLRGWESLGYASLSWLSNDAHQSLTSNRMEFAARPFRYARLSWREGAPLLFAGIVAESPGVTAAAPAFDSVTLKPAPGKFAGDLLYSAAPAIPVRRIDLLFPGQNVVLPAVLGNYVELPAARGNAATRWEFRARLQATFFQITQDGKQRKSGEVVVDEVHEPHWVLRGETPAPASQQPALKLSWMPATLIFMTSGPGPYSLRFGRARADSAQRAISQVAPGFTWAELHTVETAQVGPSSVVSVQASDESAAQAAAAAARRRQLLLWGVLLLGVGVLALMAWKLIGQMKKD
jgi:hypothetical protein